MARTAPLRRPARRAALAGAALVGAVAALTPGAATAATPATLTLQAMEPSYGPVSIRTASGARVTARLGWFRLGVATATAPSVTVRGFCDDPLTAITANRAYTVQLRSATDAADLDTPGYHAVSWLLRSADRLIAAAPDPAREAAALQVAVWKLGGRVPAGQTTGDGPLDARVAALRTEALRASAPRPSGAAVTGAAEACAGMGVVRVDVTGAPGSTARVTVDGGATVSAGAVVLDATGAAHVEVRSADPGTVRVDVRIAGGALVRGARTRSDGPQETVFVMPASTDVSVPVTFQNCSTSEPVDEPEPETPAPPAGGPSDGGDTPSAPQAPSAPADTPGAGTGPSGDPPAVPVTPKTPDAPRGGTTPSSSAQAPRLVIRKTAARRVGLGGRIRYTLVVTNTGRSAATGVRVVDPVPDDTFLTATPPRGRLVGGAVVWTLGRIAPGARRVVHLTVSLPTDRTGRVCNVARVSADGGLASSARACTVVTGRPRPVVPAVTA